MKKYTEALKKLNDKWWKDKSDPVPVEIPIELQQPETMEDKIKRIIREQISPIASEMGEETLEESQDYDIEDEFESDAPITPYEEREMIPEYPEDIKKVEAEQLKNAAQSDSLENINSVEKKETEKAEKNVEDDS